MTSIRTMLGDRVARIRTLGHVSSESPAFYSRLPGPLRSPWVWSLAGRRVLPILFLVISLNVILGYHEAGLLGLDVRVYRDAAAAWLHGANPWTVGVKGYLFAAPPPTLLPSAVLTFVPEPIAIAAVIIASLGAAIWIVRVMRRPLWWILFPPVVESVFVGNPNVLVLGLLIGGRPALDVLASFLKVYGIVPALLLGRWRSGVWLLVAVAITAPFLPWPAFIGQGREVISTLASQSLGGYSVTSTPLLIPIAIICLLVIGLRRSAWLVVPVLWPSTQLHYAVLALPGLTPLMAIFFAFPVRGSPLVAVIAEAIVVLYLMRQEKGLGRPMSAESDVSSDREAPPLERPLP